MTLFKPKSGPILRRSRFIHFLLAAAVTGYGGHLFGYEGSVVVGFASIVAGFVWEVSNRWLPGPHRYGDAWDFWAFVAGAITSASVWLMLGQ